MCSITGALRLPTMRRSLTTYRCGYRTGHHRTAAISTDPASATPQPSPRPFPGQVPPQSWPCRSPGAIQPAVHKTDQGTESEPSESAPFNKKFTIILFKKQIVAGRDGQNGLTSLSSSSAWPSVVNCLKQKGNNKRNGHGSGSSFCTTNGMCTLGWNFKKNKRLPLALITISPSMV